MKAYWIKAMVKYRPSEKASMKTIERDYYIDASTIEYARKKIARKHNTALRNVKIIDSSLVGYY